MDTEDGMSFTEFSYQLFQGYDFLRLKQLYNCRVQLGGSDQWGNIASGCELIRRVTGEEGFGATIPLLVDSKGNKLGKSEGNAIWLDPKKTTPFEMYQYFLNMPDADIETCLLKITFMPFEEIQAILTKHAERPEDRLGQKALAETVVEMAHGKDALKDVLGSTEAFFKSGDLKKMTLEEFESQFANTEKVIIPKGEVRDLASLVVRCGLRPTKADVKRLVLQGGLTLNGVSVTTEEKAKQKIEPSDILHEKYIVLKVGKKSFSLVQITE
jgi:tyrosyl-tRNA synthetase